MKKYLGNVTSFNVLMILISEFVSFFILHCKYTYIEYSAKTVTVTYIPREAEYIFN